MDLDEDLIREAQGLRRRAKPVSYTQEIIIREEKPSKRAKPSMHQRKEAKASRSGARQPASKWGAQGSDGSDDDDDGDDDSDSSDFGDKRRRGAKSKAVQRRSERAGAGGRSVYREESDDEGRSSEDSEDGPTNRRKGKGKAVPEPVAAAPVSVIEKILSQRPAEGDHAGEVDGVPQLEYLAKLRGKYAAPSPCALGARALVTGKAEVPLMMTLFWCEAPSGHADTALSLRIPEEEAWRLGWRWPPPIPDGPGSSPCAVLRL